MYGVISFRLDFQRNILLCRTEIQNRKFIRNESQRDYVWRTCKIKGETIKVQLLILKIQMMQLKIIIKVLTRCMCWSSIYIYYPNNISQPVVE